MQNLINALKQQRIGVSCAVVIALLLTVWGHAPVLPVIAGCALAIGIAILRTPSKPTFRDTK